MVNLHGLFNKAQRAVRSNPDAVRGGLDKVEGLLNTRTKGKYTDKIQAGRGNIDKALGVPGQTRDAYRAGAGGQERPGPVSTDPVDAPTPVDNPTPLDFTDGHEQRGRQPGPGAR